VAWALHERRNAPIRIHIAATAQPTSANETAIAHMAQTESTIVSMWSGGFARHV
jgi:hypothetical protein